MTLDARPRSTGKMGHIGCCMGLGGGKTRQEGPGEVGAGSDYSSGSSSGELSMQGLPGGHLQNSEVAVLQPTSEINNDFLQKQIVLVAAEKCYCSRTTLLAKGTKPSFNPHPQYHWYQ